MMAQTIQPNDEFTCPKTREKIDFDICIRRYVTANTLGKEHRLCVNCDYGRKNRKQLAAAFNDSEDIGVARYKCREEDEIKKRVRYINTPVW